MSRKKLERMCSTKDLAEAGVTRIVMPGGSFAAPSRYTARLEQLKAELNERRLTEIAAMLDDAGVPEWVENNSHRGVPSNSAVMRLKWYLARRKNVAAREIDQKLQREMKEAEANAREYMERYNAGTQRPGKPDVSLATETRKPGSLK